MFFAKLLFYKKVIKPFTDQNMIKLTTAEQNTSFWANTKSFLQYDMQEFYLTFYVPTNLWPAQYTGKIYIYFFL